MDYVVEVEGLAKRYGKTTALAGVDLAVRPGTVLGLLGPNGAGKTTAVRVLATLLHPDAGHATVGGYDVVRQAEQVRALIGLTGQYAAVDEDLTGMENLVLIGKLLELAGPAARQAVAQPPSRRPDDPGLLSVPVDDAEALPTVVRRLHEEGIAIIELALRLASLDEVFLALTGHPAEEES